MKAGKELPDAPAGEDRSLAAGVARARLFLEAFELLICMHLFVYLHNTDAGPDMAGGRTICFNRTSSNAFILMIWQYCLSHQCHLIIKRQLERCCIYSALAKRTNVWRSRKCTQVVSQCQRSPEPGQGIASGKLPATSAPARALGFHLVEHEVLEKDRKGGVVGDVSTCVWIRQKRTTKETKNQASHDR